MFAPPPPIVTDLRIPSRTLLLTALSVALGAAVLFMPGFPPAQATCAQQIGPYIGQINCDAQGRFQQVVANWKQPEGCSGDYPFQRAASVPWEMVWSLVDHDGIGDDAGGQYTGSDQACPPIQTLHLTEGHNYTLSVDIMAGFSGAQNQMLGQVTLAYTCTGQ